MSDDRLIEGDGLVLLPVEADEIADVLRAGVPGHAAGRGWPHPDSAAGLSFAATGGWSWVVVDADGSVVGECGTKAPPRPDGVVEIGYGLAAPSRGRGLGSRMVRALVGWLAARPDIWAIEAETQPGNVASRRVLERAGFTLVEADDTLLRYRHTDRG
jgi:RimJ/RimL family protein N-acetyltransferase